MKKLLAIFVLLLLSGCAVQQSSESSTPAGETTPITTTTTEQPVEQPQEIDTAPYYNISLGESKEILGKTFSLLKLTQAGDVELAVAASLLGTKNEEIIEGLSVTATKITIVNAPTGSYATFLILPLELKSNQYVIYPNVRQTVNGKDIILKKAESDGIIEVNVFNKGTVVGDDGRIKSGETKTINGLKITNMQSFWIIRPYAIVEAE